MSSNVVVERQAWMTDEVYEWACLEEKARQNTFARLMKQGRKALIAIKAQHPLNSDGTPGPEYEQRLEKALRVKRELEEDGLEVDFMTFGGVHSGHETITLADAGADWLMEHGVGADAIQRCPVVYSGNDEDRMAAEKFAADENYSQLHVVMSAGQWERARLYYMFCGWQPTNHAITFLDDRPNHSTVCELWGGWAVPAFAKGVEEIRRTTEEIRQRHLNEAHN